MCYIAEPAPLLKAIISDAVQNLLLFLRKIQSIGLSADISGAESLIRASNIILIRLFDSDRQALFAEASKAFHL